MYPVYFLHSGALGKHSLHFARITGFNILFKISTKFFDRLSSLNRPLRC